MTTMPANPTPAEGVVVPLEDHGIVGPLACLEEIAEGAWPGEDAVERIQRFAAVELSAALAARPAAPTQSAAQTGEVLKARVDTLVNILAPDQGESLSEERRRLFAIASAIQSDLHALSQPEQSQ